MIIDARKSRLHPIKLRNEVKHQFELVRKIKRLILIDKNGRAVELFRVNDILKVEKARQAALQHRFGAFIFYRLVLNAAKTMPSKSRKAWICSDSSSAARKS